MLKEAARAKLQGNEETNALVGSCHDSDSTGSWCHDGMMLTLNADDENVNFSLCDV
jgi:hypothetical protein